MLCNNRGEGGRVLDYWYSDNTSRESGGGTGWRGSDAASTAAAAAADMITLATLVIVMVTPVVDRRPD